MLEVKITEEMKKRAYDKAISMGELKHSITRGEGNIVGFLGEEIVSCVLDCKVTNTFDYDLVYNDLKYDVKTKKCTSRPKPEYECSIAAYSEKQACDRYIFVRIEWLSNKATRAWILGWKDKKEYLAEAKKMIKGEVDESNGFIVREDCYNLPISNLENIQLLYMFY